MGGTCTQDAIEGIYRRHFKLVYQICLVMLKSVPDAEDAAQTVFRRVMERGAAFRDPEHEKAWLIVTARNECRDQLKHWWRRCRADASALDTLTWEAPEDGLVWEQVTALPEQHRLVLLLHYYQGYTTDEIARMLEDNPSTVRGWLVQARGKLKELLEVEEYGRKFTSGL